MATNPPKKPPEHDTPTESCGSFVCSTTVVTTPTSSSSGSGGGIFLKQRRSACSCSNISIMQLFHEMKQKFPTVPDHVVSDVVTANCHNRPACITNLEKASLGTPASVQAYPSQSIHSTSLKRRINERKLSKLESSFSGGSSGSSSRESSVDKASAKSVADGTTIGSSFVTVNNRLYNNNATTMTVSSGSGAASGEPPRDSGSVNNNTSDNQQSAVGFDNNNHHSQVLPSRPNTLAFSGPRPTRVAPLPPISSTITASPELGETVNVQLNVTVSPVASRSPIGQRHTSTLQLQPEPPYSRELAAASSSFNTSVPLPPGANSRSSTSVNLTLRQPSEGPQSPIHILASPLKYTAKGFNAQSGIQSKLEITFRDGFGSISAMRTHVPGHDPALESNQPPSLVGGSSGTGGSQQQQHQQEDPYRDHLLQQQMAQHLPAAAVGVDGTELATATANENDGLSSWEQLQQNYRTEIAITEQIDQKNRLSEEVERYRQQLGSIRREIYVLEQPLSHGDADNLRREVQSLEEEVDRMQKEVDSGELNPAGISDGLNALSIEGTSSHLAGPILNRPPRPPRPPPPKVPANQHPPVQPAAPVIAASTSYTIEGRYPGPAISASSGLGTTEPAAGSRSGTSTGEQWTCSLCTFQNHELMTTCEVCSLPKLSGRISSQSQAAPAASPSPLSPTQVSSAPPVPPLIASTMLLQSSSPSSSSSASSSAASTPQSQPPPPPMQNAQYQKSSIEC